jgi:hypothetical protein
MKMEYYFNELEPRSFQRLLNTIIVARLGEDARITPLVGRDKGRDAETADENPHIRFEVQSSPSKNLMLALDGTGATRPGQYIFQAKFHRTSDSRISDLRSRVLAEFSTELRDNILPIHRQDKISYFILATNVPGSGDAIQKSDQIRRELLKNIEGLHADIWWQDQIVAYLDTLPAVWRAFPVLFAGGKVPLLADIVVDP